MPRPKKMESKTAGNRGSSTTSGTRLWTRGQGDEQSVWGKTFQRQNQKEGSQNSQEKRKSSTRFRTKVEAKGVAKDGDRPAHSQWENGTGGGGKELPEEPFQKKGGNRPARNALTTKAGSKKW